MADTVRLLFGVHNHQPVGNFPSVIADAVARAYDPFLRTVADIGVPRHTVHCSGGLLAFLREHARSTFDLLGRLVADGRVELLTGGFYEPILPMLPDADKVGQIQALTAFLRRELGARARGMWVAERVWEPHLPRALAEAGVEFVLVDDAHFGLAGLDPEALGGHYLTEDQGARVAVFPISQRLRYLVPFAEPEETVAYLAGRRDAGAVTLVDDGEKFGIWPGTDRLVYDRGWLRRFFETLAAASWIELDTFSRHLDAHPARGSVYLPAASYAEMGEWALPAAAAQELEEARDQGRTLPGGERLARLLRGGQWRNFLVKYPEVGDLYWKMLGVSRRVREALEALPGEARLLEAREQLWRAQANDGYWHGVFGGCYLPHLRRSARSALLECQRLLGPPSRAPRAEDENADGRAELRIETPHLSLVLNPERGGSLTEIGWIGAGIDVGDVLTRRREAYHSRVKDPAPPPDGEIRTIHAEATSREAGLIELLGEDPHRRASLLDGVFPPEGALDARSPWGAALGALAAARLAHEVAAVPRGVEMRARAGRVGDLPLAVAKVVAVPHDAARVTVRYRLEWAGAETLRARWGVQWNLALTAGEAPGRYYAVEGHPSLGSRGQAAAPRLVLVDEWLDAAISLEASRPAEVSWAPVETVSLSESGYEKIYQGSAILFCWPLALRPGDRWEVSVDARLARPARILLEGP